MKIAIIGAGFAGLATAYFLLESQRAEVTLFEAKKIGGGASGASSGLLHPYPGIEAKRSQRAEEALLVAKHLLRVAETNTPKMVASYTGIFRKSLSKEQHDRLVGHCKEYCDIEQIEKELFLIHSAVTVYTENYLEGLALALQKKGAEFRYEKVKALSELSEFDQIIVAAGYGIREFPECEQLNVKFLKGQSLSLIGNAPYEKSFISKGYIAHLGNRFDVGSTYERSFKDDAPNLEEAKILLKDKLALCPKAEIVDCKAGIRVCSQGHYLPIVEKVSEKAFVFTGLGSRGLLYHGLYGRSLANLVVFQNALIH